VNEIVKGLFDRIRADKRTTVIAAIAAGIWGTGQGLSSVAVEPWGTVVSAFGIVVAGGALLFTTIAKPPEPPQ
jgi:hypothetical protein